MAGRSGEPRILLVEDDETEAALFSRMLQKHVPGTHIDHAGSGEAAMSTLHAGKRPDCIVLDLRLPGEDGI